MTLMGASWMRSRADLRGSWRAVVACAVLVGIGGGVALAALVGARRTQTSVRRFLAYNQPEDLIAVSGGPGAPLTDVLHLPEVASYTRMPYLFVSLSRSRFDGVGSFGVADDQGLHSIERPLVVHGRLAGVDQPFEAVIDEAAARQRDLHVGSSLAVFAYSAQQVSAAANRFAPSAPDGPQFVVRIVGVVRQPTDIAVVPVRDDVSYESSGSLYFTPAFVRTYADALGQPLDQLAGTEIVRVRLHHGTAELDSFRRDAVAIAGDQIQIQAGSDALDAANAAERGITLEALALLAFGALALIATIGIVGQMLARQSRAAARDHPTLTAMGMTRRQLVRISLAPALLVALVGASVAVAVAVAFSPLTPIGLASQAETHPGVTFNLALSAIGFVVLIGAIVLYALGAAVSATSAGHAGRRTTPGPGPVARELSDRDLVRSLLPITMTSNLAGGRSQSTLLRRGAVVGLVVAVAGVAAGLTFSASLAHVIDTPVTQGWNFDVLVGNPNAQSDQQADGVPLLAQNPLVGGFSSIAMSLNGLTIDGHQVGVVGVDAVRGGLYPPILAGRPPAAPDEIMLATRTLTELHRSIGDMVSVTSGTHQASLRVVGRMLNTSAGDVLTSRLDQGGVVTLDGLRRLTPDAIVTLFAVRYATAADPDAAYTSLRRDFGPVVFRHVVAQDVENVERVAALPAVLAALVVVLAIAALSHALITGVARTRKNFAIAQACGFVRRQLAATVFWQTWWLTIGGLAIGLPLGIITGRLAWRIVAQQIGTTASPSVPAIAILLITPVALALTGATAALPAWIASRVSPCTALHRE